MADIELRYKKRKCEHFCCGDCIIDGKSCGNDIGNDAVCIDKFNKYKQCLDEIKEILEDTACIVQDYETSYDLAQEILQKIKR